MLPASVNEYVEQDALCRFVVDIVSLLDLRELYSRYCSQGGDSYSPDMLLALWFFAYTHGIVSTRELEERCIYDLRFKYITADLHPDHSTLSRFRQAHLDLMKECFVQLVQLAHEKGISDFKRIHIDGTKLQAKASKRHNRSTDSLGRQLNSVRKQIDEYMLRCDESDTENHLFMGLPEENPEQVHKKLEQLRELEKQLEERHQQLHERKKTLKSEHRRKHKINLKEPEARNMRTPHGIKPSYNAQAAVDEDTQLIVASDLVSDTNDFNQLSNIHQQSETNLVEDNGRQYNTDAGYHNMEQLEDAQEQGIDLVTNDPAPDNRSISKTATDIKELLKDSRALKRGDFGYDEETDCYCCPASKRLVMVQHLEATTRKGERKVYQAESSCVNCPLFKRCMPKKSKSDRRRIIRDLREKYAEAMARKLLSDEAKQRLRKRMTINEPVFGNIKQNLGFQRFSLQGHAQARGEYQLMCIAHNLNVLYRSLGKMAKEPCKAVLSMAFRAVKTISKTDTAPFWRYITTKLFKFTYLFLSPFNLPRFETVSATACYRRVFICVILIITSPG
jgi:transposase